MEGAEGAGGTEATEAVEAVEAVEAGSEGFMVTALETPWCAVVSVNSFVANSWLTRPWLVSLKREEEKRNNKSTLIVVVAVWGLK